MAETDAASTNGAAGPAPRGLFFSFNMTIAFLMIAAPIGLYFLTPIQTLAVVWFAVGQIYLVTSCSFTKPNFNTVMALLFIAAAVAMWFVIPIQIEQPRFNFGRNALDPELFPRLVAVSLFVVGEFFLGLSFRYTETNLLADLDREAILGVAVTMLVMAAYVFVVVGDTVGRHIGIDFGDVKIGFVIPSVLLIFVLSTFYGNRNWILGIGTSLAVPVTIYLVFGKFLMQPLPRSPITEWAYAQVLALLN